MNMHMKNPPIPASVAVSVSTPDQARKLATALIDVMSSLLEIVERETELVRAGKMSEAMALENKKKMASDLYVGAILKFKESRDYMARATPDLLATLHRHHDVFRAMLQINLTVLATAHAVTEGIVRGVNDQLQRRAMPNGYTAGGKQAMPNGRHATPLAVSRTL